MVNSAPNTLLTNRDEIVGLPAVAVRHFLTRHDDIVSEAGWNEFFAFPESMVHPNFEQMIQEGYFEPVGNDRSGRLCKKTLKAVRFSKLRYLDPIPPEDAREIVLELLDTIDQLNCGANPYRIRRISFTGDLLDSWRENIPFVLAEVYIRTIFLEAALDDEIGMLREQEIDFANYYINEGCKPILDPAIDKSNWAKQWMIDQLLEISPYLCIRSC